MSGKQFEIDQDTINKALETLGINLGGDTPPAGSEDKTDDITKSEGSEDKDKEKEKKDEEDEVEKAYCSTKKEVEDMEKALSDKKAMLSEMESKKNKKEGKNPDEPLEKSVENDIIKANFDTINQKLEASTTLLQKSLNANEDLKKENDELKKSVQGTFEMLDKLTKVVTEIGNQSLGRKSVMTSNYIEKGFGGNAPANDGKKVLSLSKDSKEIEQTLLDFSNIEKGEANDFYSDAAILYNTSKTLNKAHINDLFVNKNIRIVD